jgi:hypothetical protein
MGFAASAAPTETVEPRSANPISRPAEKTEQEEKAVFMIGDPSALYDVPSVSMQVFDTG